MAKTKKFIRQAHPHLALLEDISTLIGHSHDLQETLDSIVAIIADRMGTEVCSIYILDQQKRRLTLCATRGLDQESVGKVSMGTGEGLTRVGHRANETSYGRRRPGASPLQILS